jgi:hypothetical protein
MLPCFAWPAGWWFLPFIGIFVFMMLACFLFRRVFRGRGFCCAGGRNADLDDPVRTLKTRYAKGEVGREELDRTHGEPGTRAWSAGC